LGYLYAQDYKTRTFEEYFSWVRVKNPMFVLWSWPRTKYHIGCLWHKTRMNFIPLRSHDTKIQKPNLIFHVLGLLDVKYYSFYPSLSQNWDPTDPLLPTMP
jgi:hypothetical protein